MQGRRGEKVSDRPRRPSVLPIVLLLLLILVGSVAIFAYATIKPLVAMTGQTVPRLTASSSATAGTPAPSVPASLGSPGAPPVAPPADVSKPQAPSTPFVLPSLQRKERVNFLLLGSDTDLKFAPGEYLTQSMIVVTVDPVSHTVGMLSIPRDLWVNIPGMGMSRINSAFDNGASLLVQTIQTDLGIPVNHYVEVNFDTFRDITAAVGGVSFYFPTPAKDAFSLLNVTQPGCVALSGDQALGFVRSRHYEYYQNGSWHFEAESDLARIKRQQTFIRKMIKKAESKFTDIGALNGVIGGITKNLTVDSGFSNTLLLNLAKDFHGIDPSSLATVTLPNYGYTTAGGADVLGLQQPQAAQTIAAFNTFGNNLPAASGHSKSSNTTTPKTVPAVKPPKTTVAPSKISVEVANGDGVVGQAAAMNTFLTGRGFRVQTNVISPIHGLAVTQVRYAPDSKSDAEQVASLIPGGATLTSDSNLTLSPYNVEVVTGSSYTAASGGPPASSGSSSSSSTASTAPTTTIPGTNSGTYVLPGMPAGATPPSC
jgi:polyisoprenyl-teichoic acid--peptidoglycan teichoic acid transferase